MSLRYYSAITEEIAVISSLPSTAAPFAEAIARVLPPQISDLHQSLARWGQYGASPGPLSPERMWLDSQQQLYVGFASNQEPQPLAQTGLAAEIAAWLVLLDCWMETYVVIARARSVWTPDELAGALTFLTPAFLPPSVAKLNPNWEQVAAAVALAVADGPLAGQPNERHWKL